MVTLRFGERDPRGESEGGGEGGEAELAGEQLAVESPGRVETGGGAASSGVMAGVDASAGVTVVDASFCGSRVVMARVYR